LEFISKHVPYKAVIEQKILPSYLKMWSNCCNSESPGNKACLLTISAATTEFLIRQGLKETSCIIIMPFRQ